MEKCKVADFFYLLLNIHQNVFTNHKATASQPWSDRRLFLFFIWNYCFQTSSIKYETKLFISIENSIGHCNFARIDFNKCNFCHIEYELSIHTHTRNETKRSKTLALALPWHEFLIIIFLVKNIITVEYVHVQRNLHAMHTMVKCSILKMYNYEYRKFHRIFPVFILCVSEK